MELMQILTPIQGGLTAAAAGVAAATGAAGGQDARVAAAGAAGQDSGGALGLSARGQRRQLLGPAAAADAGDKRGSGSGSGPRVAQQQIQ